MPHPAEPRARVPTFFPTLGEGFITEMRTLPGWEMSRGKERGREDGNWKERVHCREVDMVMQSREAVGVSLPEVKAAAPWPQWLSWPHLLSLAMVAEAGDQKELPAGQERAAVWCVLILGLRSSEGPRELQGGEGKAVL